MVKIVSSTQENCHTQLFLLLLLWGPRFEDRTESWRDGSTVKNTCCSCGRPSFDSQHPHGRKLTTICKSNSRDLTLTSDFYRHCMHKVHIHAGKTFVQKIKTTSKKVLIKNRIAKGRHILSDKHMTNICKTQSSDTNMCEWRTYMHFCIHVGTCVCLKESNSKKETILHIQGH